ncbi:LL-diaminopimelate aminotransferase [bacterium]|nr:MAG: LL-diaminopimelate aminotransferase [bacterium]
MNFSANRLSEFGSYAFAELSALKREVALKRRVIDMGVGDPDIPPPKEIQGALVTALGDIDTHRYADYQGDFFVRKAMAKFFLNRYKKKLDPETNMLGLIGSKEGICHLPLAVLNPGDIGAYTEPGYPVYHAGIVFAGGTPVPIPLREDNNFVINPDDIPDNTKLLWVNYPNNPTSACIDVDLWKRLVDKAHECDFIIANDAAYIETYFEKPPHSILEIPGAMDVAVEFHSLSKTFCMTGWRIGFVIGNERIISALACLKRYIDSGPFRAVQYAAKNALDNYFQLAEPIRSIFARRVKFWLDTLRKLGIESFNFGATFYVWSKVPQEFDTASNFAKHLLETTGIVTMPGSAMGTTGEGFVRFSLTLPDEDIKFAAEQISRL